MTLPLRRELTLVSHVVDQWSAAVGMWLIALRAAGRPATTIRLRRYQLMRLARDVAPAGPWELSGMDLVQWMGSQPWGRDTMASFRAGVRMFYRWALANELTSCDPSRALPTVRAGEPNPRPTPAGIYDRALERATDRVRLMLRLAAELGMRRGEVARTHRDDLERDLLGWTLVVHGKGSKVRRVPVPDGLAATIRSHSSGSSAGFLFPGRIDGHLSPGHVGRLVADALPGVWAMHSLRHKFGTAAYGVEQDIVAVQELLGHVSLETTRRYVKVPAERLRRTVEAVGRAS